MGGRLVGIAVSALTVPQTARIVGSPERVIERIDTMIEHTVGIARMGCKRRQPFKIRHNVLVGLVTSEIGSKACTAHGSVVLSTEPVHVVVFDNLLCVLTELVERLHLSAFIEQVCQFRRFDSLQVDVVAYLLVAQRTVRKADLTVREPASGTVQEAFLGESPPG